jgi:hypothetical protein
MKLAGRTPLHRARLLSRVLREDERNGERVRSGRSLHPAGPLAIPED